MLSYRESLEIIEKQLLHIAEEKQPSELYQPIKYILSIGGKRIRPCLSLMSYSLFSDEMDEIIDTAVGIEVFHNFTLMHDDMMDNASMRRNYDTVHVKWDNNVAILSGDAMLILAYQLISGARANVLSDVLSLYNRTALEVCEGQQYDMNFELSLDVTVDEYLNMIRLKTAVLIATSLALGGIVAATTSKNIEALYQFGLNVGIAFQLQDDYLDVFAEGDKFGKAIGNDILANKKTFLLISALQSENDELVSKLKKWIAQTEYDPKEKIREVKNIYLQLKINDKTLQKSQDYFAKGIEFLKQIDVPEQNKAELLKLVDLLLKREH